MNTIIIEKVFPAGTPRADLEAACAQRLQFGALTCHIEDRGHEIAIITVRPRPAATTAAASPDGSSAEATAVADAKSAVAQASASHALGVLSKRFESNGNPAAVGEDSTGGPSYGTYQIATKTGTMASFLKFLERSEPEFAAKLVAAGGEVGALSKSPTFVAAWTSLAADSAFAAAQHAFIKSTHYDPFVQHTQTQLGLDLNARSMALQNVAWSTAVQHGPGNRVFRNALQSSEKTMAMTDGQIVDAVYDERSKVENYFGKSTEAVRTAVKNRFAKERTEAHAMLV